MEDRYSLAEIFCEYGWPDEVRSTSDGERVRIIWEGVGERTEYAQDLVNGLRGTLPDPKEKKVSIRDARRAWKTELISFPYEELPLNSEGERSVKGRFRFTHWPQVEFDLEVLVVGRGEVTLWSNMNSLLPADCLERIKKNLAALTQEPEVEAEKHLDYYRCRLLEAALALAHWQEPGEVSWEMIAQEEGRSFSASADGYRSAGSFSVVVKYNCLKWYVPTMEGRPSGTRHKQSRLFETDVTEEEARSEVACELQSEYAAARKQLMAYIGREEFPDSIKFLDEEKRNEWEKKFLFSVKGLVEESIADADATRLETVRKRSETMRQWRIVKDAEKTATAAMQDALSKWLQVANTLPTTLRPPMPTGDIGEMRLGIQRMLDWAEKISAEADAMARETGTVLLSRAKRHELEQNQAKAPWFTYGLPEDPEDPHGIKLVEHIVGRKAGDGVGRKAGANWFPGDDPLVVLRLPVGTKRFSVEVTAYQGLELIDERVILRHGNRFQTYIFRAIAPNWKVVWEQKRDNHVWSGPHAANIDGVGDNDPEPWKVISRR